MRGFFIPSLLEKSTGSSIVSPGSQHQFAASTFQGDPLHLCNEGGADTVTSARLIYEELGQLSPWRIMAYRVDDLNASESDEFAINLGNDDPLGLSVTSLEASCGAVESPIQLGKCAGVSLFCRSDSHFRST